MPSADLNNLSDFEIKILKTAAKEFEKKGYHDSNVEEIAAKVGIGKGTIYRHFGPKAALFMSVIRYSLEIIMSDFYHMEDVPDFETALNMYIEKSISMTKMWGNLCFSSLSQDSKWTFKRELKRNKNLKKTISFIKESREKAVEFMKIIIEKGQREGKISKKSGQPRFCGHHDDADRTIHCGREYPAFDE
jgi:AcrR family transcriptional regulator